MCNSGALTSSVVCATLPPPPILTLKGEGDPDSTNAVQCLPSIFLNGPINSNDALACIAQIEAAIVQICTPFSPSVDTRNDDSYCWPVSRGSCCRASPPPSAPKPFPDRRHTFASDLLLAGMPISPASC